MSELDEKRPKRKVLSLKKEKQSSAIPPLTPSLFVKDELSVYMVWCPEGNMPKKVYGPDEQDKAIWDARHLAHDTKRRFYVMRAWRGFDPAPEE